MAEDLGKIGRLFESFASAFLRPLLVGGEARTTRALPPGLLDPFAQASSSDPEVAEALSDGVLSAAAEIAPIGTVPSPDRGAMALVMAAHDLALVTDPMLDRVVARRARPKVVEWAATLAEAIGPPRTRGEALHRHVWFDRFLALEREDTVVRNWAYTYRFYGRPPPANVVALPRLRFVRQEHNRVGLLELIDADEDGLGLRSLLDGLLARSPVTQLLRWRRLRRPRLGAAALACLSDARLRAGVAHQLVRAGTEGIEAAFGFALRELHAQGAPPSHLRVALSFVAELQLLELVDPRTEPAPPEPLESDDARLYAAVLPALVSVDPAAALNTLAPSDRARALERATALRAVSGDASLDFVRSLLDRSLPLSLSSPAVSHPPSHPV